MSETNSERMDTAARESGWSVKISHGVRIYEKNGEVYEVVMRDDEVYRVREDGRIVAYRELRPDPAQAVINMLEA